MRINTTNQTSVIDCMCKLHFVVDKKKNFIFKGLLHIHYTSFIKPRIDYFQGHDADCLEENT